MNYQFHPVAEAFPLMNEEEMEQLIEDIRRNGQINPIIIVGTEIVDGRNRFLACERLGIEPKTESWDLLPERVVQLVVSLNLHRRHLNESQRGLIANRLTNLAEGRPQKTASIEAVISQTKAAEMLNVSRSNVQRAAFVEENGVIGLVEQVEDGEISVSAAAKIASLPKTKQMRLIKKGREAKKKLAAQLREKKVLQTNRETGAICLCCNEEVAVTKETLAVHLTKLIDRAPKFKRFFDDILEELEAEDFAADYSDAKDKILLAIDNGYQEFRDIQNKTKIETRFLHSCLSVLMEYGVIEALEQGGKTDTARGQRKVLYLRIETAGADILQNVPTLEASIASLSLMKVEELQ